jgi:hypothetical protein
MASLLDQLFPAIERQESGGNPFAISPKGAFGPMQLMPATAAQPGFGVRPFDRTAPDSIAENRRLGRDYFTALFNRYSDVPTALIAYNWGPGNADKWIAAGRDPKALPAETRNYVAKITGGQPMTLAPTGDTMKTNGLLDGALPQPQGGLANIFSGNNPSSLGQMLLALGAGIASGSTEGWGPGIGRGLALAQQTQQNAQENQLKRLLLGAQMAPEVKEITLPGGGKVSARVGPGGQVTPLDTSALGPQAAVPDFENATSLRKEYQALPQYKTYQEALPIYRSMTDAAKRDSRASDLNLVYGMAKIFDPNSVVREGEQVIVKDTASLPDWLQGEINRLNGGASLQRQTRTALLQEARSRIVAYQDQLRPVYERYSGIAGRYGIPGSDLATDLQPFPEVAAPSSVAGGTNFSPAPSSFLAGASSAARGGPPPTAIQFLKANPATRAQFEAKYGVRADAYLGR